jgi:Rod binding domain-containing protein
MSLDPILTSGIVASGEVSLESLAHTKDSPEKIREAATQFEALLIGQVLKTMHEGDGQGWLGSGEDESGASAVALADEYFARALAARGGLGLASMISKGIEHQAAETAPAKD